jgi:hypothetical protein
MTTPKLKNNPMEQKAKRELEKNRNPWQQLKEAEEDLQEKIQKEELCSCNKNIVKSTN